MVKANSNGSAKRILLIGTARSGTTWVGQALGCAENANFINEPDNVEAPPVGEFGHHGFGPYPIIAPNERSLRSMRYAALWDLAFADATPSHPLPVALGRAALSLPAALRDPLIGQIARIVSRLRSTHRHVIAKSVFAHFCLDWLGQRYCPQVVLLQRHPLNVIVSWMELPEPLYDLSTNPLFREHIDRPPHVPAVPRNTSQLGKVAWCVGLLTAILHNALERHPDWPLVTHEEMCTEPRERFSDLYARLGLTWADSTERFLRDSERPGSGLVTNRIAAELPEKWRKRLTAEEVREIMTVLDQFPTMGWVRPPNAVVGVSAGS
jgi:hypothetical protein